MKLFIILFIFLAAAYDLESKECHIKTNDFVIIGSEGFLPRYNMTYESYKCIRYAEPPIGDLRFWPPVGIDLKGTIYANKESCPMCPQLPNNLVAHVENAKEDCLYLNVFVPRNCGKRPLEVMVYLHGGNYIMGQGPPYYSFLLGECVIVVTLNYRIGALGFLSLQTPQCAGNVGLKDQQLAMTWVNNYIQYFGGDPHNIVLYGLSAGGASATYHYLNSKSCKLFARAIIESGTFLNPWAYEKTDIALEKSQTLAANLGCTGTDEELCACLKTIPSQTILAKTNSVLGLEDILAFRVIPFLPVVETEASPDPFITADPYYSFVNGLHCKRNLIIGVTKDEGCVFNATVQQFKFALPFFSALVKYTAPSCMADNPDPYCNDYIPEQILGYYTENNQFDDQNIFRYITDEQFKLSVLLFVNIIAKHGVTVWLYEFTFSGDCGVSRVLNPSTNLVCHGEMLPYIFSSPYTPSCSVTTPTANVVTSTRLVSFYANFAKYGTPTLFIHSGQYVNVYWLPWNRFFQFYLEIGESLTCKTCLEKDAVTFWNQLSSKCCEGSIGQNIYPSCPSFNILN